MGRAPSRWSGEHPAERHRRNAAAAGPGRLGVRRARRRAALPARRHRGRRAPRCGAARRARHRRRPDGAADDRRHLRRVRHDRPLRALVRRRAGRRRGERGRAGVLAGRGDRVRRHRGRRAVRRTADATARGWRRSDPACRRVVVPDRGDRHAGRAARAGRKRLDARRATHARTGDHRAGGQRAVCDPVPAAGLSGRSRPDRIGDCQRRRAGGRRCAVRACAATGGPIRAPRLAGDARSGGGRPRSDRALGRVPGRVPQRCGRRRADGHRADRGPPDRVAVVGVHRAAARLVRDRRAVAGRRRAREFGRRTGPADGVAGRALGAVRRPGLRSCSSRPDGR